MRWIGMAALAGSISLWGGGAVAAIPVIIFDGPLTGPSNALFNLPEAIYHARLTASAPSSLSMSTYYEVWSDRCIPPGICYGDIDTYSAGSGAALSATELLFDFVFPRSLFDNGPDGTYISLSTVDATLYYSALGPLGTTYHLTLTAELFPPGNVPEPGTWTLLILGFGLAGGVLRRTGVVERVAKAS